MLAVEKGNSEQGISIEGINLSLFRTFTTKLVLSDSKIYSSFGDLFSASFRICFPFHP